MAKEHIIKARENFERGIELTDEEIRRNIKMYRKPTLDVPLHTIPDGMDYMWGRESIFGDPSFSDIEELRARGWLPVPKTRHPSILNNDPMGIGSARGYIYKKGQILLERRKEYGEIEKEVYNKGLDESLQKVHGLEDGVMALENKTSFSKSFA